MSRPLAQALAPRLALLLAAAAALLAFSLSFRPASAPVDGSRASERVAHAPSVKRLAGPYRAESIRVVDGDTFEARLRIWFNQDVTVLVRLDGVDAPELRGRCAQESRLAQEARDALLAIVSSGEVTLRDLHSDKYNGRAVARATVRDASGAHADDVGELLIAGGYARAYDGRARAPWCATGAAVLAEGRRAR